MLDRSALRAYGHRRWRAGGAALWAEGFALREGGLRRYGALHGRRARPSGLAAANG